METKVFTKLIDRKHGKYGRWPKGPWDKEPEDKMQWQDEDTGLPCLVRRNYMGAWCGYVGVPKGHLYYEQHYDKCDVSVHGGLTYSDHCNGDICHIVSLSEDDVWWLGFDCGHYQDLVPGMLALDKKDGITSLFRESTYRTLDYVRAECRALARQLHAVKKTRVEA